MGFIFLLAVLFTSVLSDQILIISLGSDEDHYLAYQAARVLSLGAATNVTLITNGEPGPRVPGLEIVIISTQISRQNTVATQENVELQEAHLQQVSAIAQENLEMCQTLYRNSFALTVLEKAKYDLAIVMLTFSDACILPLMKVMNIPVIGLATSQIDHPWVYYQSDVPYPLSYIPVLSDENARSFSTLDKLNNFRRWWNYLSVIETIWQKNAIQIAEENLKQKFNLKELYDEVGIILTSSDLVMDHPIPVPPHVVHAGCFYCLSPLDFEGIAKEFAENVRSGIVFITTDCPLDDARTISPTDATQVLIDAVLNAGYSAIVATNDPRLREHRPRPGVLYMRNPSRPDVLGNPKTRLVISRCSFTETFESLYYGVPIICLPVSAAQRLAANRAVELGAAERWQWSRLAESDSQEVTGMVEKLIKDKSYREALRHISQDLRDRPLTSLDVFLYWVNYAIRHQGHTHLRSEVAMTLPTSSYYFVDVIVLVIFSVIAVLIFFSLLTVVIARMYLAGGNKSPKKHV